MIILIRPPLSSCFGAYKHCSYFILSVTSFVFGFCFYWSKQRFLQYTGNTCFSFFSFALVFCVLLHSSRTSSYLFVSNFLIPSAFPIFCVLLLLNKFSFAWESAHRFSHLNNVFHVNCKMSLVSFKKETNA